MVRSSAMTMLISGGHLSCNFYSGFSVVEKQYDAKEAALHSHFEKLNFDAVREVIAQEELDCEFKYGEGGWDVFLTDEEFELAKRELEGMRDAGGYTSTLKIFEGEAASKVYLIETVIDVGYRCQVLCWSDTSRRTGIVETICASYLITSNTHRKTLTSIAYEYRCYFPRISIGEDGALHNSYTSRNNQGETSSQCNECLDWSFISRISGEDCPN
jgi:hypothetical protein